MTNETFFQFIWQYCLFSTSQLLTIQGEDIIIHSTGKINTNEGPDFEEAKITIGNTLWVGNVELHIKSSDWNKHRHQLNKKYNTIILHVVYEHDLKEDITPQVPTLVLKNYIPQHIIDNYSKLDFNFLQIPCARQIRHVSTLIKESCLSRMLAERWEAKFLEWRNLLLQNNDDWRVLLYWSLASNFGFKTNNTPFLMLAQSLPLKVLAKHHDNLFQIEALLFGQAGFLSDYNNDMYSFNLNKEYKFLASKYQLTPIKSQLWKFMRMRPTNFPTIRIAQFATLIYRSINLFTNIIASSTLKEIYDMFEVNASDYWDNHFRFDEIAKNKISKNIGKDSINNIIINTIAPIRYMYLSSMGQVGNYESAVSLLEFLPEEKNKITRMWEELDWKPKNAAQSQAQIQLYNNYCTHKKCLSCSIGHQIIKLRP